MHYEKYLINLSKQEKLNVNSNIQDNLNTIQNKDINKFNFMAGLNQMNPALAQMNNIQGQMGNFMTPSMGMAMNNIQNFNMRANGMPFMQMNPQMLAKMMGKMYPNSFQQ